MNIDSATLSTTATYAARDETGDYEEKFKVEAKSNTPISNSTRPKARALSGNEFEDASSSQLMGNSGNVLASEYRKNLNTHSQSFMNISDGIIQQLLDAFIGFFAKKFDDEALHTTWMNQLPQILANPNPKSIAVKESIIAASIIHSASNSPDNHMLIQGYRWYGSGLSSQRKELNAIEVEKRLPTFEELCTPLMLSFCEISRSTSRNAYFDHLFGAVNLLVKYGPEKCGEGGLYDMFYILRLQLVCILCYINEHYVSILTCSRFTQPL